MQAISREVSVKVKGTFVFLAGEEAILKMLGDWSQACPMKRTGRKEGSADKVRMKHCLFYSDHRFN
jgi:hypothetical protein